MALMTKKDLASKIRTLSRTPGQHPICEGCKKPIRPDEDPGAEHIDCSYTKRGRLLVWHEDCYRKAWDSKIS